MSPEDVFASQMWPWPDPAIKRDSMGRVLFMNAAFLQLYGGTIEDWRGNVVSGWPAPQPPGMPYRFETRMPAQGHEPGQENVYDWIEYTLADGSAMALARNVTHLQAPLDPKPGDIAPPPQQVEQSAPANQAAPLVVAAVTATAMAGHEAIAAEPAQDAVSLSESFTPQIDVPEILVPEIDVPDLNFEAPISEAAIEPSMQAPAIEAAPQYESLAAPVQTAEVELAVSQELAPAPDKAASVTAEPAATDERAYERRALPLENNSAVLGNNWRDAVIAKAVGAELEASPAETESASEETINATSGDNPIRILLAEDNAINALLTRTLLEAEGHVVDTVEDGLLAVEAMKTSSYDLIFMDMRMPNMDGLESTRKIRALDNVPKGLPIIALTANAFDDDRNACFDSGMNDFMTKPVSAEELTEMVRTWTKNLAERNAA